MTRRLPPLDAPSPSDRGARVFFVSALVAVSLAGLPGAARAEDLPTSDLNAEARARYKQGTEALTAHRYVEAALHFETATSKNPHAVAWYMAAEAWERAGKPERAADALARALEVPGLSPELGEKIRPRLKVLESTVGTVLFGGATSYRVAMDGNTTVAPPARLHGLPGTHTVTIVPPDRPRFRREVSLTAGTELAVTLGEGEDDEVKPVVAAPSEAKTVVKVVEREVPAPGEPRRYVGFATLGVGAAALLGGLALGAGALDAKDAYATSRTQESFDHVRSLQAWANVSLVAGSVLAVTGIVLVLWPDDRKAGAGGASASIRATPLGAELGGRF